MPDDLPIQDPAHYLAERAEFIAIPGVSRESQPVRLLFGAL